MAKLLGNLIAKARGAEGRDRQAAGGNHQRLTAEWPDAGLQHIATTRSRFDLLDARVE